MWVLQIKHSNTPNYHPTSLEEAEIAANTSDGILYLGLKNSSIVKFKQDFQESFIKNIITDYIIQPNKSLYFLVDTSNNTITNEPVGTGDGSTTTFNLLKFPIVSNSETIIINGTSVPSTDYTLNYTTGELVFNTPPGDGDIITANYQKAQLDITLQTSQDIVFSMKRIDNSSYPLIITPSSGTIDGQSSITIDTQYISYKFVCDGTNWWIF